LPPQGLFHNAKHTNLATPDLFVAGMPAIKTFSQVSCGGPRTDPTPDAKRLRHKHSANAKTYPLFRFLLASGPPSLMGCFKFLLWHSIRHFQFQAVVAVVGFLIASVVAIMTPQCSPFIGHQSSVASLPISLHGFTALFLSRRHLRLFFFLKPG
jgi:hypothetical protein